MNFNNFYLRKIVIIFTRCYQRTEQRTVLLTYLSNTGDFDAFDWSRDLHAPYQSILATLFLHVVNNICHNHHDTIAILTVAARYGDGAGNTVEENSSIFSLIRMC